MKPKYQRLLFIVIGLAMLGGAAGLILHNFKDNIVFYFSPDDLRESPPASGQFIRLGGFVEEGSVRSLAGGVIVFVVTDFKEAVAVRYTGALPALFREGQGVVAEGSVTEDGSFAATRILAKHDEKYMPPEVKRILKQSGRWKDAYTGTENSPVLAPHGKTR